MKIDITDKLVPIFFARARQKHMGVDEYVADLWQQLGERIKGEKGFKVSLADKVELSKYIIERAFNRVGAENLCVAWTGGKDSTVILWMVREVVKAKKLPMPRVMFINEGHVFEEIREMVAEYSKKWKLTVDEVHNADVSGKAKKIGDEVKVSALDKRNREEVRRLGYKKASFAYEPESLVGNHLMKTVAMNRYLEKSKFKAVMTGIRWDEQGARNEEVYFSPRGDEFTPEHVRVHPILHISEKELWEIIHTHKIPFCKLYEQGYRSLGAKGTTSKADDKPAWEQDYEKVSERAGRRQDKEEIMKRLRDLGYM